MKAITLTQPWATLVAIGAKHIETRSWPTQYRGPLAIHAGVLQGLYDLCRSEPFRSTLLAAGILGTPALPRGAIVATCMLVGCEETDWAVENNGIYKIIGGERRHWPLTDQELAFGDYTPGRFAWLLADVKPLAEPIPARGALGLWEWNEP